MRSTLYLFTDPLNVRSGIKTPEYGAETPSRYLLYVKCWESIVYYGNASTLEIMSLRTSFDIWKRCHDLSLLHVHQRMDLERHQFWSHFPGAPDGPHTTANISRKPHNSWGAGCYNPPWRNQNKWDGYYAGKLRSSAGSEHQLLEGH